MPPEARDQRDLEGENCRSDAVSLPPMSGTDPENAGFGQHVVVQRKDDMSSLTVLVLEGDMSGFQWITTCMLRGSQPALHPHENRAWDLHGSWLVADHAPTASLEEILQRVDWDDPVVLCCLGLLHLIRARDRYADDTVIHI